VLWAFVNDTAQRVLTFNKREQRANVRRLLRQVGCPAGARVLDYGCGTGLFATTLAENGSQYVGYDIDQRLVEYASRLYASSLMFTHKKDDVVGRGPYDCVLANCCFHHIPDAEASGELGFIRSNLDPMGCFVMLDILASDDDAPAPPLRHVFGLIEQGGSMRRHQDNIRMLESQFDVVRADVARTHLFSMAPSPLYNNLGIYVCRPSR
jgi:cyclopropane fatty-acyl-phospholipid synthase-like methyltransferase